MTLSSRTRLLRRASTLGLLTLLWALVASDQAPASLSSAAFAADGDFLHRLSKSDKPEHDLSALKIFNRVVILIKDNYVDPKRVDARKMMTTALDYVERQVAEVMVDGDEKSPKIKVTVNKASKEFDVSGVDSLWRMSFALKEVFDFINKNLLSREDTREIEYAAVNGMLSTLDPHSVLLKPDYFKEMKLQTKGEFGGLGFVIQMKEGNLTVVKVLKGTPAHKAGIKAKDQIVKIGNESTINMDLNEAVSRLRGKPGSEISITINRVPTGPKALALTRAIINVESVEAKLLDKNIGYIKLKGFQGNTARDMHAELRRLKAEVAKSDDGKGTLKGLVLDMRGNPGGLLEQAIQISDAFIDEGTIVTTVGYSDKLREVKKAHPEDTERDLPIVVLVNSGSASASEIVSGALKNLNRAVIVGRQTFGKGSVQVLYDFPDESALKLTIAQYLTPGDISIQEVGITPDIQLIPSRVAKERIDVFAPKKLIGEADLDKHFGNPASDKAATKREEVVPREKPLEELRFLREEPVEKPKDPTVKVDPKKERPDRDDYEQDEPDEEAEPDEIAEDYQIRFARDLLLAAPANNRKDMLKLAKPFIAERRKAEEEKIKKSIEALGIDWSLPEGKAAAGAPKLSVEMKPGAGAKGLAGETLAWTVTAENTGTAPFKRLRAYSESENPYLDRREFLFGSIGPGEKRAWTVNVRVPKEMPSRRDDVTMKFFDEGKAKLDDLKGEINLVELPRPAFAYSWQIVDKCEKCNGDGIAQLGETVEMQLDVKNIGAGKAFDSVAVIKNKADENIFINKGRVKLGELKPGESRGGVFEFEVKPEYKGETFQIQLTMGDEPTDEYVSEKLDIPVGPASDPAVKTTVAAVKLTSDAALLAAASATLPTLGKAKGGSVLPVDGKVGEFYRVKLPNNRVAFIAAKDAKETKPDPKAAPAVELVEFKNEPKITLAVDTQAGGISAEGDRYTLTGSATDRSKLRDLYIFVNDQKVFFKAAADESPTEIKFSADFPLKVGNNTVLVVAREGTELMARRTLVIHRRGTELAKAPGKKSAETPLNPQ